VRYQRKNWILTGKWTERTWALKNCAIVPQRQGDLKPNMKVRNIHSKFPCDIATVHGTREGNLAKCADYMVVVRRRYKSGKNKGRVGYFFWRLRNLIILSK
jgi:hypothetical protein